MTILFKQLFSLLKLLNSETGTNQISAGVAAGFILGMTPSFSLQTILIILCIFTFRIQIGAALLSAALFAFPAYLLDNVFHSVGSSALQIKSLIPLYTQLYNMPIVPFTRFNNSVVMGSGLVSIALAPIVYLLARVLIIKYRKSVVERIKNTKIWKALKATSFYKLYLKYSEFYG